MWQLDRAEQKQQLLNQVTSRADQAAVDISELIDGFDPQQLRYSKVTLNGRYRQNKSIYIDNQVLNGQVGYLVFTPFEIANQNINVMVNRGWLPVGESRQILPDFTTTDQQITLMGRLNNAPAQPPLWDDSYPISQGPVWAYLPISEYASQMQLKLLPLVVELAPLQTAAINDSQFVIKWPEINDEWVAKHKGYAFQWLMMALAFFIACLVLLLRHIRQGKAH